MCNPPTRLPQADFGRIRPTVAECWPSLVQIRPKSSQFGRPRTNTGQCPPTSQTRPQDVPDLDHKLRLPCTTSSHVCAIACLPVSEAVTGLFEAPGRFGACAHTIYCGPQGEEFALLSSALHTPVSLCAWRWRTGLWSRDRRQESEMQKQRGGRGGHFHPAQQGHHRPSDRPYLRHETGSSRTPSNEDLQY